MNAFDIERHRMQLTRHRLSVSGHHRQWAVASFPVGIAEMAMRMHKMCEHRFHYGATSQADEIIDSLEREIRKSFRDTFGSEMFPGDPQDKHNGLSDPPNEPRPAA